MSDDNNGYTTVAEFTGGEVLIGKGQFVVLGAPLHDDEGHNCDAMGCGSAHVIYREAIPTTEEMNATIAEYTSKIDAAIEKGKTNLACHWCGEVADVTDQPAINAHYRTCPKSPLVAELAAALAEVERMRPVYDAAVNLDDNWDVRMMDGDRLWRADAARLEDAVKAAKGVAEQARVAKEPSHG